MTLSIARKNYSGPFVDEYTPQQIGPLEKRCLENFDGRIADLFALFLNEGCAENGILTEESLFDYEQRCNTSEIVPLNGYTAAPKQGALLTAEQIRHIFRPIWKDYLFIESTGMDWDMMRFFQKWGKSDDADELLYASFRFCAWGEYDNPLPYTLYRCLFDGRFRRFYGSQSEWPNGFFV